MTKQFEEAEDDEAFLQANIDLEVAENEFNAMNTINIWELVKFNKQDISASENDESSMGDKTFNLASDSNGLIGSIERDPDITKMERQMDKIMLLGNK